MIRVIMGKKGSGKTKQMIDMINEAVQTEHGNVVCIDSLTTIVGSECDHETEKFLDWLNNFGEKHNIKFTITISDDASLAPDGVKKYF